MEKNMNAIMLEFEEINSTINKYLDDIESENDEKLAQRQKNRTTDHQKSSLIAKKSA